MAVKDVVRLRVLLNPPKSFVDGVRNPRAWRWRATITRDTRWNG